jgi:hypothetical protein
MRLLAHVRRHVVGYLALFLVLGGVGHAALVASDGTIKACVIQTTSGTQANTRIIDETASCTSSQTAVSWNQRGQAGPAGPTGPPGQPGQPGSSGTPEASPEAGPEASSSAERPGKPAGGLSQTGKLKRSRIKRTKVRRFVVGFSGPAEQTLVSAFQTVDLGWQKTAMISCTPATPVLLNYSAVGIAGTFDENWGVVNGQYGAQVQKAYYRVVETASGPDVPASQALQDYRFRIQGECVDL